MWVRVDSPVAIHSNCEQVAYYGLGLNSSDILQITVFPSWSKLGIFQNVRNISVGNIVLACAGLIPGFWVTFAFIDVWGRKPIQLLGFSMLTLIFLIMGMPHDLMEGFRILTAIAT